MPLSGPPPTILIADDDHAIAAALLVLFELHDFHADAVHTPADALERVRRGDVCLVVHDMNFSKGDTRASPDCRCSVPCDVKHQNCRLS